MRFRGNSRLIRKCLLAIAAASATLAMLVPADAQFWGSWGPPQRQQRQQPQQQYSPFGGGWFGQPAAPERSQREREAPVDYSRAPSPPRKTATDTPSTTNIVVLGDGMADWLAYGLEDAFSEKPEFGIVRKHRTTSGLIRYEPRRETEWAQVARDIITAEKPKFIVMMVGINDRQAIRERAPAPATPARPAAAGAKPGTPPAAPAATAEGQPPAAPPVTEDAESPDQPAAAAPEPARPTATGSFEFHTEKWEAAYIRRIDATMAVLKSSGVPVLWVGLPAQRISKASSDSAYLNDLYRSRAEKAGITYVDVWDGFVDEGGRFAAQGPDFEGQIRRLRSGDGVYFTKAGARKLAHYVEREIMRNITNRAVPVALPTPEPQAPGAARAPAGPAQRPLAGPVVPLNNPTASSEELMGGARPTRPAAIDPVAVRVLTKGEPIRAPSGRADNFAWPRGSDANNAATVEPDSLPATAVATPAPAATRSATTTAAPSRDTDTMTQRGQRVTADRDPAEPKPPIQRRVRKPAASDNPPRPPLGISNFFR